MIAVDVQNLTAYLVDEKFAKKAVRKTLRHTGAKGAISVGVVFVGSRMMRKINKEYNNKDKATDVLSFGRANQFIVPEKVGDYLGEIIVCPQIVKDQAKQFKIDFMQEFAHVIIHGTLHLLGYEHEHSKADAKKMHAKEEEIMAMVL